MKIFKYPTRFVCDRADAFRNWSYGITRNTVRSLLSQDAQILQDAEIGHQIQDTLADTRTRSPFHQAADAEAASLIDTAYLIYLNLYLLNYRDLALHEQRALHFVEVEGSDYRSAASRLEVRVSNFKMLLFRARRKIHRGIQRTLACM